MPIACPYWIGVYMLNLTVIFHQSSFKTTLIQLFFLNKTWKEYKKCDFDHIIRVITLQGKSLILLSQYWKNEWLDCTIIISYLEVAIIFLPTVIHINVYILIYLFIYLPENRLFGLGDCSVPPPPPSCITSPPLTGLPTPIPPPGLHTRPLLWPP